MTWTIKPDQPSAGCTIYADEAETAVIGFILFDQLQPRNKWAVGFEACPDLNDNLFTKDAAVGYVRGVERALTSGTDTLRTLTGTIRAVVAVLRCPRNRFGRLEPSREQYAALHPLAVAVGLPHGGADIVDQACMILQGAVGDKPQPLDELAGLDMAGQRRRAQR